MVRKTTLREVKVLRSLKHENIVSLKVRARASTSLPSGPARDPDLRRARGSDRVLLTRPAASLPASSFPRTSPSPHLPRPPIPSLASQEAFRRKGKLYLVFEYVERNLLEVLEQRPNGLDPETVRRYLAARRRHLLVPPFGRRPPRHQTREPPGRPRVPIELRAQTVRLRFRPRAHPRQDGARAPDGFVATRWYRAPGLLLGSDAHGFGGSWAIGCIMGELIDGQPLFPGESDVDQLYIVQKHMGPLTEEQRARRVETPGSRGRVPRRGFRAHRHPSQVRRESLRDGVAIHAPTPSNGPARTADVARYADASVLRGMEGYDARAPGGPNAERAEDAEKSGADVHAKRGDDGWTAASPKSKPLTPEEEEEKRRKARARENATRLRREREAAEAEAREREKELRAARERAREELEREARAAKERKRREREREEKAREEREERERRAAAAAAERARAERDRERERERHRERHLERSYFGADDFPSARAAAEPPSRVGRRGGLFPSDPDRDPPSFSAADPARPARLPRISRLDARRSETGSVARGSRRASRREISSDAFADEFPSARAGAHAGTGSNRRANAAFDEAFGLGLRGIEFGAASRRGERRPVAGRRAARGRDSGVGDADDLGALLHASKIGSREVHIGSREVHIGSREVHIGSREVQPRAVPRRTSEADSGVGLGFPGALPPAREGRRAGLPRGAGGELGTGSGTTRRGVGLGAGAGPGGARPQLRFGGGDAGAERGGGFDRSKYVVPPVPTYEERRRAADARGEAGWRRRGGRPIDASAPKHARVARGGRMM